MSHRLAAVTVVGNDRPGIVATVAKVLYDAGCNLEDASSTILRGHFSMMLVVRMPGDLGADHLEERLARPAADLGLVALVRGLEDADAAFEPPTHVISVYGADRPGIVYHVARLLAERRVNITDLQSRVIGPEDEPVYALLLEAAVPAGRDLSSDLESLRGELGVEITVHPIDAEML